MRQMPIRKLSWLVFTVLLYACSNGGSWSNTSKRALSARFGVVPGVDASEAVLASDDSQSDDGAVDDGDQPPPSGADAVIYWNEIATRDPGNGITPPTAARGLLNTVGPPAAFRFLAMMHLAMHDAVNAVDHRYQTYFQTRRDAPTASKEAAASRVAFRILTFALPSQTPNLTALYTAYIANLATHPDGDIALGIALGDSVSNEMIAARTGDGSAPKPFVPPPPGPGVWQPNGPAVLPQWGGVKHFFPAVGDHGHVAVGPPPSLDSSTYQTDLAEVASLGQNISTTRAADQTEAALFWAPNEQMWVCQFLRLLSQGNISRDAQRFARVTATMEDSAIDGFYWKYQDVFWRPYQALNQPGMPPWVPLRPTPNHPEYPSAHTFLMSPFVGLMEESTDDERPVTFNSSGGVASKTRSFEDLNDALQELKSSRVYIGFHYRNSTNVAEDLGRAWADTVIDNDYLGHAGDSERENGDSACEVGCNR